LATTSLSAAAAASGDSGGQRGSLGWYGVKGLSDGVGTEVKSLLGEAVFLFVSVKTELVGVKTELVGVKTGLVGVKTGFVGVPCPEILSVVVLSGWVGTTDPPCPLYMAVLSIASIRASMIQLRAKSLMLAYQLNFPT